MSFIPEYRKKVMYGNLRTKVIEIIRNLCCQRATELTEQPVIPDGRASCDAADARNVRA